MTKSAARPQRFRLARHAGAPLLGLLACARVSVPGGADGGAAASPPRIADLQPAPGPIEADARFHLVFSEAMDEGALLASTGRSETVVLTPDALVERVAAAIEHTRLTVEERSLVVPALASIAPDATALDLVPDKALPPGGYWLLLSTHLKDGSGEHLQAAARFHYTVAAMRNAPTLIAPLAGSVAAANRWRVRVWVPEDGGAVSVVGTDGPLASASAVKGMLELPLCPSWSGTGCSALRPGAEYSVALDGKAVPGATFTASQCPRLDPPRASLTLHPRDTSISADVRLDWPARISMQVGPCPGASCGVAEGFASCAPDPCAAPIDGVCALSLRVGGLLTSSVYPVQFVVEDDEGHLVRSAAQPVVTTGPLPHLVLSEVMASPPLPTPRSDGEYVEILNAGNAPVDLATVALQGSDGIPRLVAPGATSPIVLDPGMRALAVGSSFDVSRYVIPSGIPVLRASTQRLLGRGLSDDSPPLITLLAADAAGATAEVDRFPGGEPKCAAGLSIEAALGGGWICGAYGGSPGRAP
ncbi:MAG TPA: hypothetical protein VG496_10295 [Myxococcales bacterium]|nr:hypothetical protein [Myxococcales bacterium]